MIAALLVAAAFGAGHAEERSVRFAHWQPSCVRRGERRCRRRAHRLGVVRPAPPSGSPVPTPTPGPTPAPTPPPLPSRTSVDLAEWRVTPAYRTLRAGEVEFNAANLGEDDHDFSLRNAGGAVLANEVVLAGDSVTVRISLAPAVYTLYCSLPDHEARGMRADITVR